jgi:hypothetical protein
MNTSLNRLLRSHAADAFKRALVSGGFAGLLSLVTLVVRSRQELGKPAAAVNAPSQWVHGDEALSADSLDARHTLTGTLIHQASAVFWGLLFEQLRQRFFSQKGQGAAHLPALAAGAAGLTAVAAVVDLKCVPSRLTPGFDKRLSNTSLVMVYASFAVGLAAGAAVLSRRSSQGR